MFTDKLFTGQREMAGLGIYQFGARFYSPKLGRFISADSIVPGYSNPQAFNRYSYALNNPIKYNDPSGHGVDCGIGMGCVSDYISPTTSSTTTTTQSGGGGSNDGDGGGGGEDSGVSEVPINVTLHPLEGNVLSQVPIYDYSNYPPMLIGNTITSYAYDKSHFSIPNLVIPSDPITFTSTFADIAKALLKPMVPGVEILIPGAGEVLSVVAALDSLNSAITFDTHLRTHDVLFYNSVFIYISIRPVSVSVIRRRNDALNIKEAIQKRIINPKPKTFPSISYPLYFFERLYPFSDMVTNNPFANFHNCGEHDNQ